MLLLRASIGEPKLPFFPCCYSLRTPIYRDFGSTFLWGAIPMPIHSFTHKGQSRSDQSMYQEVQGSLRSYSNKHPCATQKLDTDSSLFSDLFPALLPPVSWTCLNAACDITYVISIRTFHIPFLLFLFVCSLDERRMEIRGSGIEVDVSATAY